MLGCVVLTLWMKSNSEEGERSSNCERPVYYWPEPWSVGNAPRTTQYHISTGNVNSNPTPWTTRSRRTATGQREPLVEVVRWRDAVVPADTMNVGQPTPEPAPFGRSSMAGLFPLPEPQVVQRLAED